MAKAKAKTPMAATIAKDRAASRGMTKAQKSDPGITPEQRQTMIREAAYFMAEKAEFSGDSAAYWLAAEKQIDALIDRK